MTGPEEGPWDSAPRAALAVLLARYYDAQLDFRDSAAPWLAGELPVPIAQLKDMEAKLYVLDQLSAELRGEMRAIWFQIKAARAREAA